MLSDTASFYVTTPIYYANGNPHIGHAYTTLLADVLSRYHRLMDVPTFFLTGTDEHGEKVMLAAEAANRTPQEQVDETVVGFQELWKKLGITHDDFIRTTQSRHKEVVSGILSDLYERDEIYRGEYEGWYCVHDERFFTEKDLVEGNCPECHREVQRIVEVNYFFRMSKYQQWLIDYIEANPTFIQPDFRRNETLGFLRQPLTDLCISRPKSRLSWGIDLPFDNDYVCYVWFDALVNYISAIGYRSDAERFDSWWPPAYHLIGKDILTTHTVYWPTMLKAMGVPMPKTIFAHGWWLVGRDKMGKSLGNVVDPMTMCDRYGVDPFRYFVLAEMTPGQDASFTEPAFVDRYNLDLADSLGNMLNRVVKLARSTFQGTLPAPGRLEPIDEQLQHRALAVVATSLAHTEAMRTDRAIAEVMLVVRECNRYFEQTAPWKLAKSGDRDRLGTILYTAAEALRIVAGLLHPVMPGKMTELRRCLGLPEEALAPHRDTLARWGRLQPGTPLPKIKPLFPKIDVAELEATVGAPARPQKTAEGKAKSAPEPAGMAGDENVVDMIEYQDVIKLDLRVARVTAAEKVAKADKLLRLDVEIAGVMRQLVAGIAQHYQPEAMVGKLVVVVANLKPRKLRGLVSEGMLLAATTDDGLRVITVDGAIATGARVS